MNILFVAGSFNNEGGRPSSLANKIYNIMINDHSVDFHNGGYYNELESYLAVSPNYDSVWWFANVPNDLPKVRDVKEIAPFTMFVASKRNDNNKYTSQDIIQRALMQKANLLFEFSKTDNVFNIRVFDPLGCIWANTTDVTDATKKALDRLVYLKAITRQRTEKSDLSNGLVFSWYFDSFKLSETKSNKIITVPDQSEFINVIHDYAEIMQTKIMPIKDSTRFLGNASIKMPPQVGRCSKTMPSFMKDNMIFVSRRNVPKQFIEIDDFVPVYMEDDKLFYCGDFKPSVDTPVQIRLYKNLPKIRYMIHFHAYIKHAPFTNTVIPCGAVDEAHEVLTLIDSYYQSRELTQYVVNLNGHGAIIMSDDIEKLKNYSLVKRDIPEKMF